MKPKDMDDLQLMQWVVEYQERIKGDYEKEYHCEADNFDPDDMHLRNSLLLIELGKRGLTLDDVRETKRKLYDHLHDKECKKSFEVIDDSNPHWKRLECKKCGIYGGRFGDQIDTTEILGIPHFVRKKEEEAQKRHLEEQDKLWNE